MSEMNLQRKKVVVLGASVACMAAPLGALMQRHPHLGFAWLGLMFATLGLALYEFVKLRRSER